MRSAVPSHNPGTRTGFGRGLPSVAEPRRPRSKCDAARSMRRNERRALFRRAVHVYRNLLPAPVQLLRRIGLVVNIDRNRLPFPESQQRSGELAVVRCYQHDAIRRELDGLHRDGQCVIGGLVCRRGAARVGKDQRPPILRGRAEPSTCRRSTCCAEKNPYG